MPVRIKALVALGCTLVTATLTNAQSYFSEVGYTDLQARLGAATPTGAGVLIAQVEALEAANSYLPNPATFPGKTIVDRSVGGAVSGHATFAGRHAFGDLSLAPGITTIHSYRVDGTLDAGDWFGGGYLRVGTTESREWSRSGFTRTVGSTSP